MGPLLGRAVPKGVRFESDVPEGLPRVPVAPHKLTQAVLNLIVNAGEAIQSMPKLPRRARVRLWAHAVGSNSGRGRHVHVGVGDNGPGMSPEIKARAFDAFFTTKSRGLGTGLGLPLVRSVVVTAGGELDVDSKPGKGTEVVLSLPAVADHDEAADGHAPLFASIFLSDIRVASMASARRSPGTLRVPPPRRAAGSPGSPRRPRTPAMGRTGTCRPRRAFQSA